ncbi:hypothetical protein ASE37_21245 [Rhizobium sp. Root268]|nr:hypothetical protein ASC86_22675 [Rhizobium sp. Root1212]KRD35350.1 hypothetical protein ASE37_21245 [Rhizobium sp. Root268]
MLIFLSHAAADLALVEAFENLLTQALNITSESIFCSSLEGQGVTKGANFVDGIKDKAAQAKAVIALISPAYLESPFCLAELGAAWVLNTHRFPIVVPPNSFEVMQATLLGVVGVKIDQQEALTQMLEDIGDALDLPAPKAGVRMRAMRRFAEAWPELKQGIRKATRVDASIHEKVLNDLKETREAWEANEAELEASRAHVKALKQLNPVEAAVVSKAFENTDWETEFESAIREVSAIAYEVGGGRVLRLMILELLGKPSVPDRNDDNIERAVEIDVYDPDTRSWNRSSDEMKALSKAMEKVDLVFEEHDGVADVLKQRGKRHKTDDIRFWEEHVGL